MPSGSTRQTTKKADLTAERKITPLSGAATGSADIVGENLGRLRELFPELITENEDGVALNVDVLKQLVGDATVTDAEEKYGLNWHGKRRARQLALTPSTGTLRPCPEESVDWDTTQNLMIEGDNLEVLKLLQKSYAGKVKLIYIDPPYNTGKDFVYPDNFQDNIKNYLELTGQVEGGNKISSNTEASGRFHTDWLNMMYPRLKLARNLLREDGVICVSIDDNELSSLRKCGDEIFGEENFEGHIHWRRRHNQPNDPTKMLALVAEHLIVYAKNSADFKRAGVGKIALTGSFSNPDEDPRGDWASKPWKVGADQSGSRYKITTPTGSVLDEDWMGEETTFKALLDDGRIIFPDKGRGSPRKKYFKTERAEEGQCATNWWPSEQFGENQTANREMEALFGEKNVFSSPKPVELASSLIAVANVKGTDILLDFFAGSGTSGHAALSQNAADGGKRRYVLVQLPEPLEPDNKDQMVAADYCDKLGKPRTIAELTKERLRRAGKKIKAEHPDYAGDLGFRVFKLDTTNIRAWDPDRGDLPKTIEDAVEHVKRDRTDEDVLFELLLKLGLDLTVAIEKKTIAGKDVHSIGGGALFVCLAVKITAEDVDSLALGIADWRSAQNPAGESTVVFRDSAFVNDVTKTNVAAILEQHGFDEKNVRSL